MFRKRETGKQREPGKKGGSREKPGAVPSKKGDQEGGWRKFVQGKKRKSRKSGEI